MSAPVKDQRFQKVHNDPRFARNSKRKNKLQIDKRFAGVFKDERFQSGQGKYDKYGRRIEKKSNDLKKFYRLEDEEDEQDDEDTVEDDDDEEEKAQVKKSSTESSSTTSDEDTNDGKVAKNDEKLTRLEYLNLMARGELASDSDDSSDSDSDADSDDAVEELEPESEKEDVPMGEETKRFAVQNCDWTRIRAVDIFALCQSFAPATGVVRDVTIYPSDYGLQKMKEEEQHGPQGLWADDDKKKEDKKNDVVAEESADENEENDEENDNDVEKSANSKDEDDEEAGDDEEYDSDDPLGVKKSVSAEQDNGFDAEKLRKYELQKLKYYYAIVTCDSVKTASAIFDNCDQLEYETSSNVLDLRFVPDDIEFTNKPKDVCTSVPDTYKPSIFATTALQNTDVKLTWEEDDDNRLELLTRQADWKNFDDNDFSAYLASDNSSDEGGDDSDGAAGDGSDAEEDAKTAAQPDKKKEAKLKKLKNRYRKMLLGSDAEDESDADDNEDGSDSDAGGDGDQEGEMEMTFTPGAGDILKAKKQRELEENETPFERYAREKKQKKNQKLHEKRTKQKQLEREQKEVLKKKGKGGVNQVKLLREVIEDDDEDDDGEDGGDRNFDLKKIQLSEKVKKLKGKRKAKEMKKLEKKTGLQEGFEFDAADPRFGALYAKGSQFQLDPTDPKFKKTEANQKIFQERRKRNEKAGNSGTQPTSAPASSAASTGDSKSELKAIVENLKRKSHQQRKPSVSKKQKL